MKKSLALLLAFTAIASFAYAQKPPTLNSKNYDPVDPKKDQRTIQGYIVRLRPGLSFTYLFDVLDQGKLVHEAAPNVLNTSVEGYETKEDAYTVAAWVINQYKTTGHIPSVLSPEIMNKVRPNSNHLPR